MTYQYIIYSVEKRIATIILNRPEKRNALNTDVVSELKSAFATAKNDTEVKLVILKANGEAFCAGADLGYLQQLQNNSYNENLGDSNHLKELFATIYHFPKIVIAQIEGAALAGGCGLATVCDFSFATPESKFGFTEVKIGFIPAIVMIFLLRKIGEGKAKQLLLTGDIISANESLQMGLINFIEEKNNIQNAVNLFCEKLLTQASTKSLELTKQMIANVQNLSIDEALNFAASKNAHARATDDCKKGIAAFLNKEKLTW